MWMGDLEPPTPLAAERRHAEGAAMRLNLIHVR
jgi:hypothetical protein